MRLFFAIDLPEALHEPMAAVQADLADAAGLSFTDPAQAHLTMKFLGETPTAAAADGDEPSVDDAKLAGAAAVDAADLGPFEVEVGGLGAFPSTEYISVVWAGVDDGAATEPVGVFFEHFAGVSRLAGDEEDCFGCHRSSIRSSLIYLSQSGLTYAWRRIIK